MCVPALKAIFYSEFDNVLGPKLLYQWPPNFLAADKFDGVSDYVITGKPLCGKLIVVNAYDLRILGYPLCIENEKYHRNALLFNVGFVFGHQDTATEPYHCALRKIALTLYSMELESAFLFDPKQKDRLQTILPCIMQDLNQHGECAMLLDDANMLNIKLFWAPSPAPEVCDHHVPVLMQPRAKLVHLDGDLALRQVIPHIDGIKYAKKISLDAEVDIDVVKRCLRALLYYKCIAIIDIFQYCNQYVALPRVAEFARRLDLQQECVEFVRRTGEKRPGVATLARLYGSFRPGITVQDLMLQKDVIEQIDHRRFLTFGSVHGLVRRLHRYPICLKSSPSAKHTSHQAHLRPHIQRMMDGTHSADELCCHFMMTYDEIESVVKGESGQVVCVYK